MSPDASDGPKLQAEEVRNRLRAALEGGDPSDIARELGAAAKAAGMAAVAREVGVSRGGLYASLSEHGDPRLSTVLGVLQALGLQITVAPVDNGPAPRDDVG